MTISEYGGPSLYGSAANFFEEFIFCVNNIHLMDRPPPRLPEDLRKLLEDRGKLEEWYNVYEFDKKVPIFFSILTLNPKS